MKKENDVNKSGFTLIEILIVVLIIGLLVSIAVPGYRKAVEKSKVTGALNTMQAVAKSEHGWYLVKNNYTKDFANLDIDLYDKDGNKAEDEILQGINYTYELLDTGILATRTNGEYSIYQDYDTKQIMCTPGTHFICDNLGAFTKEPCEKVGLAWANTNSTCYANEEARCKGLYDDSMWKDTDEICGYKQANGKEINEGMICIGSDNKCRNSIVNSGGECRAGTGWRGCEGSTINAGGQCVATGARSCNNLTLSGGECIADGDGQPCWYSSISAGGKCGVVTGNNNGCAYAKIYKDGECSGDCYKSEVYEGGVCSGKCEFSTIYDGGICRSSAINYCKSSGAGSYHVAYIGTGCCEGDYCGNAPKCVCPIDETTGKHKTSC